MRSIPVLFCRYTSLSTSYNYLVFFLYLIPTALKTTKQSTAPDTRLSDVLANRIQEFEEERKKRVNADSPLYDTENIHVGFKCGGFR